MVMPGVMTRDPRVNLELCGRLTALMVCHGISIAMTVVLPALFVDLSAHGLDSCDLVALVLSRDVVSIVEV